MTKKKELVLIIVGLGLLLIAITGITYAAFSYSKAGEKVNTITTGTIQMNYTESNNVVTITNALPMTNATGKKLMNSGEYFDFSVTTTIVGNAMINWEIAAKELTESTFSGKNIKYYLTRREGSSEKEVMAPRIYSETSSANNITGRPEGMMSLLTGSSNTSETMNYRLRLWVSDTYNPQGDGGKLVYQTKISVYGKVNQGVNQVMDLSGNNHHGIIVGATRIAQAMSFDGVNDYINCGLENYDFHDQVTMAIKVKFNEIKTQGIFNNFDGSGLGFEIFNGLTFQGYINVAYTKVSTTEVVEIGKFYTLVGVYNGKTIDFYIDGIKVGSVAATGNIKVNNLPMLIGANPEQNNKIIYPANIEVESAAIYTKALSESEITTNFKNSIHLTDRDKLLLYYDFTS